MKNEKENMTAKIFEEYRMNKKELNELTKIKSAISTQELVRTTKFSDEVGIGGSYDEMLLNRIEDLQRLDAKIYLISSEVKLIDAALENLKARYVGTIYEHKYKAFRLSYLEEKSFIAIGVEIGYSTGWSWKIVDEVRKEFEEMFNFKKKK